MRMVLNQWQALGHPEPEYDNDRSRKAFEIRLPYTPMSRSKAQIANIVLQIRAKNGLNRTRRKNDHDTFSGIKNGAETAEGC